MSLRSVICKGGIGLVAFVLPAAALVLMFISLFVYRDVTYLYIMAGLSYVVIAGMTWLCVRVAHISPRVAVFLTTLPSGLLWLVMFPVKAGDNGTAFTIGFANLGLGVLIAWWVASRPARERKSEVQVPPAPEKTPGILQ